MCFPNKNGGCAFRYGVQALKGWDEYESITHGLGVFLDLFNAGDGPFLGKEIDELYPDIPHYLAVRDPTERFGSLWRNKSRDLCGEIEDISHLSPDELMDVIEEHPYGNTHWFPQYMYLTQHAIPVESSRLIEMINTEVKKRGIEHHPFINKSERLKTDPPLPIERIRQHYALDCELWDKRRQI